MSKLGKAIATASISTVIAFGTSVSSATTHEMVQGSVPADGETVTAAPEAITLTFMHPVQLTVLKVTTLLGDVIPVELDLGEGAASEIAVAVPALAADDYTVEWRALAADGHAMAGSFSFTVGE